MPLRKALQASLFFVLPALISGGYGFYFFSASVTETVLSKPVEEISIVALRKEKPQNTFDATPLTETEWQKFKEARSALLREMIILNLPVEFVEAESPLPKISWQIPLFDHPEWIILHRKGRRIGATIDPNQLASYIDKEIKPAIRPAEHVRILSLPEGESARAGVQGAMKDGWNLQSFIVAKFVAKHIADGLFAIIIPIQREIGSIKNETSMPLNEFSLLARGRSNFAGSAGNRIFNLKKALSEHVHGSLIEPGGTFSFVGILDGPVKISTGWKEGLGIFGKELRPTPGGGICQTSTTVYRAALLAGLPILEQRNHSMYVTYYTKHGEGLDATIYPGNQDLKFRNDTPGYLLILARTEGVEAIVEFYGTPDGRAVTLEGPYRFHDAPEEFKEELRQVKKVGLARNDIGWRRKITRADGSIETNILLSRYLDEIPLYTKKDGMITSE